MNNYGMREPSDFTLIFEDGTSFTFDCCRQIYQNLSYHNACIIIETSLIPEKFLSYLLGYHLTEVKWTDYIRYASTGEDAHKITHLTGEWQATVEYATDCLGDPTTFTIKLILEAENESKL